MQPTSDVRRHIDGSIDFDFYRARRPMERRVVMARFLKGLGKVAGPLVAVVLLGAAFYAAPPRDGSGWTAPTASIAGANNASLGFAQAAAHLYGHSAAR